jgi:hypothetical protein
LRDQFRNYDEIRYSKVSRFNIPFYKAIIDLLVSCDFSYYVLRADQALDLDSYKTLVDVCVSNHTKPCAVFLDYFSNHCRGVHIEELLYTNTLVHYASRQDSKSHILIQLTDLLLALYTRDQQIVQSQPKRELLAYFHTTTLSRHLCTFSYTKK